MIDLARLKTQPPFSGGAVMVYGTGASGLAALRAFAAAGFEVYAGDDNPLCENAVKEAGGIWVPAPLEFDFQKLGVIVLAPGIPLHFPAPHPVCDKARAAGIPLISDIEVFGLAQKDRNRIIGITGTNGKSTTTALAAHVLNTLGQKAVAGGNIGDCALALPQFHDRAGIYVLEISSFQIDLCPSFRPDIAVLLNITPDHLDRHGGMDGYVAAKARLLDGAGDTIITSEDAHCRDIAAAHGTEPVLGCPVNLDNLPHLAGAHNAQNIRAVYEICRRILPNIDDAAFRRALESFSGLPHRQEIAGRQYHIVFINDSKATNPDATAPALDTYRNIYWIAGGLAKDIDEFDALLDNHGAFITEAFLIGDCAEFLAMKLKKRDIPHRICHRLGNAVHAAFSSACQSPENEAHILLSPACASFDQFKNFEARGNIFKELVEEIICTQNNGKAEEQSSGRH